MKQMRFWDSVSTMLVLFGFGLYGSSCCYGCIIAGAIIALYTLRCPFCRRYLGIMFFSGKKTYCPHCGSDVRADRNV